MPRPLPPEISPDRIQAAARILRSGGLVILPTRCLYGIGADAYNPHAVGRIYRIKGRAPDQPILVLIHEPGQVLSLARFVPDAARRLMDRFWPGRVTLVFEASDTVPEALTAGTGKIGIRWCGHPAAAAVIAAFGGPVTGTSANLSGQGGCRDIRDLDARIRDRADLILDAGALEGGKGSTVVDVTGGTVRILREGTVPAADIRRVLSAPPPEHPPDA